MEKIPVHNNTEMPIYVAGRMIPPGETRHFDPAQVPPEHRPTPPEEASVEQPPVDPLAVILEGNVNEVLAGIDALDADELSRLEQLEAEGKDRKTVLEAVAARRLTLAAAG